MGCGGSKEASAGNENAEPARVVGQGQEEQHQMTTPGAGAAGGEGDRSWENKVASSENPVVFFDMVQGGESEVKVMFSWICWFVGLSMFEEEREVAWSGIRGAWLICVDLIRPAVSIFCVSMLF